MDRLHVPIMADSLLSSIATFHTTKPIVTDPTKYSFIGSIPDTMLACVSTASNVLQQYRKIPSSGPREITPAMVRSIEEDDKPAKRGKKTETQKKTKVTKPTKGQTPKNDSDSEYVPPKHKSAPPSESESESADDEASDLGDTPPRSPTPEIPVRSLPPSPPPVAILISIPPIFPIPTSQPSTTIPIPTRIFTDTTNTTTTIGAHSTTPTPPVTTEPPITTEPPTTTKPLSPTPSTDTTPVLGDEALEFDSTYFNPYRVQSDEDDDEPVTKRHLKAVNDKLDQLLSSSSSAVYSDAALKALFSSVVQEHNASLTTATKAIDASTSQCQKASLAVETSTKECKEATAKKNSQTVNDSVDNLQRSLQAERSNLEAARQAIEAANATLHDNVNDRLTQLEVELAVENPIMDELNKRTSQLKMENLKIRTATAELNDLKHLADKLRTELDILSCIKGVLVISVNPKQGGEKIAKTQPPPAPKPTAEPKVNEALVSNRDKKKKKKKIEEDDTDNKEDVYEKDPENPFQKTKSSDKELEERFKKQKAELEQKQKEKDLLEKKKSIFPEWTLDLLQRCAIDEPSTLWLEPVMSFWLDNSKDAQFDMSITPKAFIFHCFNSTVAIPSPDPKVDRDLLEFYLEFAQP
ncbi:hypothetical protein Lser_V15G29618 [Lactuca serriola]